MSPALVEKIASEVASQPQLASVTRFECGENGDALLNPQALDCLRAIKSRLKHCSIDLVTNFQTLSAERSEILLREQLVDTVVCNMDGQDETHYHAAKGVSLQRAERNLRDFLKLREHLGVRVPLTIIAIEYRRYVQTVQRHLGFLPIKVSGSFQAGLSNDFRRVYLHWRPLLNPHTDHIWEQKHLFMWAERAQWGSRPVEYSHYCCPLIERVSHEAFIAPDGTWYACCYDAECELVLGNAQRERLVDLYHGPQRLRLLQQLADRKFDEIGGPCRTVNCCQSQVVLNPREKISDWLRRLIQPFHPTNQPSL